MNDTLPASSPTGSTGCSVSTGSSLSVIVTVTVCGASVAFTGFVRLTVKTSSSSTRWSSRIATVNISSVSPAAKVSVPLAAV